MYNTNNVRSIKNKELANLMIEFFNVDISALNCTWVKASILQKIENKLLYAQDYKKADGSPNMQLFCKRLGIERITMIVYVAGANFIDAKKIDISKFAFTPSSAYYLSKIEDFDALVAKGELSLKQLSVMSELECIKYIKDHYLPVVYV